MSVLMLPQLANALKVLTDRYRLPPPAVELLLHLMDCHARQQRDDADTLRKHTLRLLVALLRREGGEVQLARRWLPGDGKAERVAVDVRDLPHEDYVTVWVRVVESEDAA